MIAAQNAINRSVKWQGYGRFYCGHCLSYSGRCLLEKGGGVFSVTLLLWQWRLTTILLAYFSPIFMDPFISFYSHLYSAGSHIILCAEQWSFAIYWETNPPSPIIDMFFFSPDCPLAFIDILMDATSHIYILDTIFISFQWALSFSQKNTRSHITAQRSFSLLLLALLRYFMFTAQYKTSEEVLHMLWQNSVNVRDEKWLSNMDSKIFKFSSSLFKLVFFLC